jgi:polysaccharide biosynthesis transport protein
MTTRVNLLKQIRDQVAAEVSAEEERLAKEMSAAAPDRKPMNPAVLAKKADMQAQVNGITTKLKSLDLDSAERVKTQGAIMDNLRQVADRIQSNPLMQGEYAQLTRDYNLAKERYDRLSSQKSSSEVANRLEDRSAGENLEVLDTASLPLKPSDPNRWLIVGVGTGIGLLLGLFLAGAQEVKDTTLKGLKDVRAYSNLQVLSSIPLLENALLVRRKRRLIWLAWSSAMIVGVVVMSSSVYYYYWGRGL